MCTCRILSLGVRFIEMPVRRHIQEEESPRRRDSIIPLVSSASVTLTSSSSLLTTSLPQTFTATKNVTVTSTVTKPGQVKVMLRAKDKLQGSFQRGILLRGEDVREARREVRRVEVPQIVRIWECGRLWEIWYVGL